MQFSMKGFSSMQANFRKVERQFPGRVEKALKTEAEVELAESKRRVPVDTGTLRASGQVVGPEKEGNKFYVDISYGGQAEDYAVIVHEDLDAFHKVGQALYLKSVLDESAPFMAQRVADEINLEDVL